MENSAGGACASSAATAIPPNTTIERYYRDAPLMCIGEGTNEMQRIIIASQLDRGTSTDELAASRSPAYEFSTCRRLRRRPFRLHVPRRPGCGSHQDREPGTGWRRQPRHGPAIFLANTTAIISRRSISTRKAVTLDLKHPLGLGLSSARATADAVLNNLRGDQPEKLGLTYAALQPFNPKIVCAHLSAYGRDNERTAWPGYDYLMQAEAGYLHLTGEPERRRHAWACPSSTS